DVCSGGDTSCQGNALVSCTEAGDAFGAPVACAAGQSCEAQSAGATCKAWVCQPGTATCEAGTERRIHCSADGLGLLETTDCAALGQRCFNGECKSQLCQPDQPYCDGKTVRKCDSTGNSSIAITLCNGDQ